MNASGVTFIGGPFIGIGFNDYLGWTHTNNTIQNADLYQLTLDCTGTKYLFGGQYLPLQHTTSTLKVLQTDGTDHADSDRHLQFDPWPGGGVQPRQSPPRRWRCASAGSTSLRW